MLSQRDMKEWCMLFVTVLSLRDVSCLTMHGFGESIPDSIIDDGKTVKPARNIYNNAVKDYSVVVEFLVQNFCTWQLFEPKYFITDGFGEVMYPAQVVDPGKREVTVVRNKPWSGKGSYGTVSWVLAGGKRAVVMWSVPYQHLIYRRWLAVGIVDENWHTSSSAKEMYDKTGNFKRGSFQKSTAKAVEFCDEMFCVQGSMGATKHTTAKISVYTKNSSMMAAIVRKYLNSKKSSIIGRK